MTTQYNNSDMFRTGDLVIGSSDPSKSVYTATGKKVNPSGSVIYGSDEDLEAQKKEITDSLLRNGGKKIETQTDKAAKKKELKKTKSSSFVYPKIETFYEIPEHKEKEVKLVTVQFENDFGKMKAKVEHIVEHDQAFMLVFKNEDDVVFEPKIGETLALYDQYKSRHEVYYPGVTFDWPESSKKIMILFKVPAENQE
jgi:hypothetical protein